MAGSSDAGDGRLTMDASGVGGLVSRPALPGPHGKCGERSQHGQGGERGKSGRRGGSRVVEVAAAMALACAWGAAGLVLLPRLAGCVPVSGGAVELRWVIRSTASRGLSCGDAHIHAVRLELHELTTGAMPCADKPRCLFPCSDYHGTTEFDIPEGNYETRIDPVDGAGETVPGVLTPPPVAYAVRKGEATDLGAILIQVPVTGIALAAAWPPTLPATTLRMNGGFR